MSKRLDWKQQRFLEDAEKCERPLDVIFQDYDVEPEELDRWLASKTFLREVDAMRARTHWTFDLELMRGARVAERRLLGAAFGGTGGFLKPTELQANWNLIKLFENLRNRELKKQADAEKRAMRKTDVTPWLGYHPSHTPERAAMLLRRIQREEARANRTEVGQDEEGKWVPLD